MTIMVARPHTSYAASLLRKFQECLAILAVAFVGAAAAATATTTTTAGEGQEAPVAVEDDASSLSWSLPPLKYVTLQPSWAAAAAAAAAVEHTEKIKEEDEDNATAAATTDPPHLVEVDAPRSHATLLAILQLYTRHVFLPAIMTSSSSSIIVVLN